MAARGIDRGARVGRLDLEQATVRFGALTALDAVDLRVAPGEVIGVLGPSGSGKSTMLRSVAGLQRLDAGVVRLDGADQAGVPPHRRGVGLMFQDHALFPHRDVTANVAFGLRVQGTPRRAAEARAAELLDLVGLPDAGGRSVLTLSGGEQQRVALARALAPDPRLLMLDEPFGSLDRALRERLVTDLGRLFRELGSTVVAVTHDQHEAFALADRVVVMDRGRILQVGTPRQVWEGPATAAVARVLALPNLLEVDARDGTAPSPWGPLPVPGRSGRLSVLVRPTAVVPAPVGPPGGGAPDGPVLTVAVATFAGDRVRLQLAPAQGPALVAEVPAGSAPAVGEAVSVRVSAEGVILVADEPA
jgi:thiamine transport system ATP-binding protein